MHYRRADEQVTLLEASDDTLLYDHKRKCAPTSTAPLTTASKTYKLDSKQRQCNDTPAQRVNGGNDSGNSASTVECHVVDAVTSSDTTVTSLPESPVTTDISIAEPNAHTHSAQRCGVQNKMARKGRRLLVTVGAVVLALLVICVIAALLVHFTGTGIKEKEKPFKVTYDTGAIDGCLSIVGGPMSSYHDDFLNKRSPRYLSFVQIFQTQMDLLFSQSCIQSFYNYTLVTSLSRGSIMVKFQIHFREPQAYDVNLHTTLTKILVDEIGENRVFGSFIVDPTTVSISHSGTHTPGLSITDSPTDSGSCTEITMEKCINKTFHNRTQFPNLLGHRNQKEAIEAAELFEALWTSDCYGYDMEFWCTVWTPGCRNESVYMPCRQYCYDVHDACIEIIRMANGTWPLPCNQLPESDDPSVCLPNPYVPGKPVPLDIKLCNDVGYNVTVFPNLVGHVSKRHALSNVKMWKGIQFDTHCYPHTMLFACAVFFPRFSGNSTVPYHTTPPCRTLCQGCKSSCLFFLEIFLNKWPESLNCSAFPESDDVTVCVGQEQVTKAPVVTACGIGNFSCDTRRCLPKSFVCDRYEDCEDGTDENNCSICEPGYIKCPPPSSLCIPTDKMCDGNVDCYGGLDEHGCVRVNGRIGSGNYSEPGQIQIHNFVTGLWEGVCSDIWNLTFSHMVCQQLGYQSVVQVLHKFSLFTPTASIDRTRDVIHPSSLFIQSYLQHSAKCSSRLLVHIKCGDVVCGLRPVYVPSPLRIVGGRNIRPGSWPWIASLHGGPQESFFCMAFIISERWIATAAHCIGGRKKVDGWILQLGHTRRLAYTKHRVRRRLKHIIVHENFTLSTVDNDIAMLQLATPLHFSDYVRPVCLPRPFVQVPLGSRCVVAGWGKKGSSEYNYLSSLEQVELNVVDSESCTIALTSKELKPPYKLTKSMFCAGGGLDHDACSGDSGAPFVCRMNGTNDRWYVGGIVSWGLGCATPYVPGVYTNIANYVNWIGDIMKKYS